MRMAIRGILVKDPSLEVIGTACDGVEGVEKAIALKPDLITMDVEMPRMDGISALKQIMAKAPTKVLMVSTLTNEGAKATFEALDAGALDYIPKNVTDSSDAQNIFREELLKKVREATRSHIMRPSSRPAAMPRPPHWLQLPALPSRHQRSIPKRSPTSALALQPADRWRCRRSSPVSR
jgi:two-component system, chemotaxis family, protein-glutamate methylesterase/glutaminase